MDSYKKKVQNEKNKIIMEKKRENGNLFMMCFSFNSEIESKRWDCCIEKFQYKLLVGFVVAVIIAPKG